MAKDTVVLVLSGLVVSVLVLFFDFSDMKSLGTQVVASELRVNATVFVFTLLYMITTRNGPFQNGCLTLLLHLIFGLLQLIFAIFSLIYFIILVIILTVMPLETLGLVLTVGRLLLLFPSYYYLNTRYDWVTDQLDPATARRPSGIEVRVRIYIVDQNQLEVQLLAQTYTEIIGKSPLEAMMLIEERRFLFERVSLFPHERDLIRDKFTSVVRDRPNPEDHCSVCQMGYDVGDKVTAIGCPHRFHFDCLKDWIDKRVNCPLCRREYRDDLLRAQIDMPN